MLASGPQAMATASLLLFAAGCPSTSVYRTAEPVPEGSWRVGAAIGVGRINDVEQETASPTLQLQANLRAGVAPDLDLGARLHLGGGQLNATWRVLQESGWSFAVAPALGGVRSKESGATTEAIHLFVQTAGIASRPLSKRWTVAAGPLVGWGLYWPESGGYAQGAWFGSFVHGEAKLGESWRLTPELGAYGVALGEVPVRGAHLRLGISLSRDL